MKNWTFGRKIAAGYALSATLTAAVAITAILSFRSIVASKDSVIAGESRELVEAETLRADSAQTQAAGRGFLLTADERFLESFETLRSRRKATLERMKSRVSRQEDRQLVDAIDRAFADHRRVSDGVYALRRSGSPIDFTARQFDEQVVPKAAAVEETLTAFASQRRRQLEAASAEASARARTMTWTIVLISVLALALAIASALILSRTLASQIGTSVSHVQGSSAELQTAANQQATGAREHATAMSEIATTVNELLATSRQIADSAQRVSGVAEETANHARSGEETIALTNDAIAGIRRQIDVVVAHMLDLGRKSQQIGSVLDIVSELAEQTNILAINATIEAAGAGESGKRFGVVADEIRKLADRVGGSTKEIRTLIDDVRGAVNTTVMATESGSKAVDVGTSHFANAASSLKRIAGMVSTTTEAAREIELSTKQQATAVEQVTIAIANISQVSKETESSSLQTLETASMLNQLSGDLLRLIRPQAA